jgi:hypothetical protein
MTTWARVQDGIVREIFEVPPEWADKQPDDLFHPEIGEWVDVTTAEPKPDQGWSYDGSAFSPPPDMDAGETRVLWMRKLGYLV